jgi:muramoyltetrapeptide carboxypeptidase
MITPRYLSKGDTVGIVAPARKVENDEISAFAKLLASWGLKVRFGKNIFGEDNQYSGSDEKRAADFQDMLDDPKIRAIISARGGYGSLRTLRLLDFSKFEKDPKWIVGFSDITIFHSFVNKYLNTESIHSLMPVNYNPEIQETVDSVNTLKKALFGEKIAYTFAGSSFNRNGMAESELAGGNLSVLYSLNGTGFFPDVRGKILFIEDIDEYLYHIDRMMLNMLMSGNLNKIKGLVVGGFTGIKDNLIPFGKNYDEIIAEAVKKFSFPVAFSFPAGHQSENNTLIFGRKMQLRVEDGVSNIVFEEK